MTWQLEQQNSTWQLKGHLQLNNVNALFEKLQTISPIQLDLSSLETCDSAGLACLVYLSQRAKQQGKTLKLLKPAEQLQQLSALYGLDAIAFSNSSA